MILQESEKTSVQEVEIADLETVKSWVNEHLLIQEKLLQYYKEQGDRCLQGIANESISVAKTKRILHFLSKL